MAALLEVNGLTTKVSGFTILNNLDFSIEENELRVLLGPNGAGKTTLISMITGQYKPHSGTIHFAGRDITGWAPDEIFKVGISRKFQVPNMYETLRVFDNVMVSLQGPRKVFAYLWTRVKPAEAPGRRHRHLLRHQPHPARDLAGDPGQRHGRRAGTQRGGQDDTAAQPHRPEPAAARRHPLRRDRHNPPQIASARQSRHRLR